MTARTAVMIGLAFSLSLTAIGCGRECQSAREQVLEPTKKASAYLQTRPSGEELGKSGCLSLLADLEKVPAGADSIRRLAEMHFTHQESRCAAYRTAYSLHCKINPNPQGFLDCQWLPYSACARWEYDTVKEPEYATAMEFTQKLDNVYERAHHLCGEAIAGNTGRAETEANALAIYLLNDVKPQGEEIYHLTCGQASFGF